MTDQAEAGQPTRGVAHRWVWFPLTAVGRFIRRNGKRVGVAIAGFTLIIVGAALLVLPGPGWLVIFLGLAVLATEFVWAERMLNKAREKARQAKDKVLKRGDAPASEPIPDPDEGMGAGERR